MLSLEDLRDKLFNAPYGSDRALDLTEEILDSYGPEVCDKVLEEYYKYLFESCDSKARIIADRPWLGAVFHGVVINDELREHIENAG